jgi:drug/metabolite transporter (DMT)-like permease
VRNVGSTLKSSRAWLLVAVAVVGISTSAPITAATVAPVLAVAFWRNLVGAGVTGAWVAVREPRGPAALSGRTVGLAVVSGLLLAIHFASWFTGLRMTSVTAATALVDTVPVWTVGFDLLRRTPVPRAVLIGVALALVGVFAITGVDAARSSRALTGDALALLGAVAFAAYVTLGDRVMRSASTAVYTLVAYAACAVVLLPVALISGTQLVGFSTKTWIQLAVVTLGAQLLGHTFLNAALPAIGVTPVALATLLEIPGAAVVAWIWLDQVPPIAVIPGTVLMLLGLVVVVRARAEQPGPTLPAPTTTPAPTTPTTPPTRPLDAL